MIASGSDGSMVIRGTMPGSRAEAAGLLDGDRIVQINGTPLADIPGTDRGKLLRSSPVTLVVDRQGELKSFTMTLD